MARYPGMRGTKEKTGRPVRYADLSTLGDGSESRVSEGRVLPQRTVKPSHQIGTVSREAVRQAVRKIMHRVG